MITLGKWEISHHDDNDQLVIRSDDGRIIANLECDRHMMDDEEIYDNALLFAGAGDLLTACMAAVRSPKPGEDCGLSAETYNLVCAAIKQAQPNH